MIDFILNKEPIRPNYHPVVEKETKPDCIIKDGVAIRQETKLLGDILDKKTVK